MMEDMLYCGSNKSTEEKSIIDRFSKGLFGSPNRNLSECEIIFEHGVVRTAIPYIYDPELDYTEGEGYARVGFVFLDNGDDEVIKFRLHQLSDSNPWYRLVGNNVPFRIDLTDTGGIFDYYELSNKNYMPEGIQHALRQNEPRIYDHYIRPLIFNYERALMKLKSTSKRILPLERENNALKNLVAVYNQLMEKYNIGDVIKEREAMESIKPTAYDMIKKVQGEY